MFNVPMFKALHSNCICIQGKIKDISNYDHEDILIWTNFSYKISYSKATTLVNKINITTYFENLTVELYVLYALNIHVKFSVNRISFTILSISLYFMHKF